MRKKLAEQGFSPASVDDAVSFLRKYRYLNDEDYTYRYLEKNGKKKSRKQIIFELQRKGIDRETIQTVMEEVPVDEEAQILDLLKKRGFPGMRLTGRSSRKFQHIWPEKASLMR